MQFVTLRDIVLHCASEGRIKKLDGRVYRPVEGAPCTYEIGGTYDDFLNAVLHGNRWFRGDLLRYLKNYNPSKMCNLVIDKDLMSFANGVLELSTGRLVRYDCADFESYRDRVASHHIPQDYDGDDMRTPHLDIILNAQLSPDVTKALFALIGRLLFPLGKLDSWHVMPWLFGEVDAGKTVILRVVARLFAERKVETLDNGVFGTAKNEYVRLSTMNDKRLIVGGNLRRIHRRPLFETIVGGWSVPITNKEAETSYVKSWDVPMMFANDIYPVGYIDSGMHIVPFMFETHIENRDDKLFDKIVENELPKIVARSLFEYKKARDEAGNNGFWSWCPQELRELRDARRRDPNDH